ncbi:hypothetical protein Mapa_014313 [Marchantia paleacea]|nr:hypothetical protein Mapa_014313 [Marchantia paleacea]
MTQRQLHFGPGFYLGDWPPAEPACSVACASSSPKLPHRSDSQNGLHFQIPQRAFSRPSSKAQRRHCSVHRTTPVVSASTWTSRILHPSGNLPGQMCE